MEQTNKQIKGVDMVHSKLNGEFEMYLPKHRAERPEWYTEKGWEKRRLQSMHENIGVGDVVFYVGAEEGEMPALCQMWGADVILIEPNDRVWSNIKAIWDANDLLSPLISFEGFASSHTSPQAKVIQRGFPESAEGEIIHDHAFKELRDPGGIQQIALDDLFIAMPEYIGIPSGICIDVEGSEWAVLRGAQNILKRFKPKIWLSLHPELMHEQYGQWGAELRRWITDLGYKETLLDYPLHEVHLLYE